MKKLIYLFLILSTGLIVSCKKDNPSNNNDNNTIVPSKIGSAMDLIRDSIYLYTKEAYLWYDGLPDYATVNPRSSTGSNDLAALNNLVNKLSQYKINPATGKPYEYYGTNGEAKYSFIDEGGTSTQLGGQNGDFGFAPFYNENNDLRVKYVYAGSPADKAGIKRGDQIIKINGRISLTYDSNSNTTGPNVQFIVRAIYDQSNIKMTLMRNGTSYDVELDVATYNIDPVITYKIIPLTNGKRVGYIVFNSFVDPDIAKPKLYGAFSSFATGGVTDLIVDLRYNGGGYVSTADYLTNLIVPAGNDGNTMNTTYYNTKLQNYTPVTRQTSILANQFITDPSTNTTYNYAQFDYSPSIEKFQKVGSLNITGNVFFIVTGSTASASELVINNLLPMMSVKLIGKKTYGKPVGFFDIKINKYELFVPEFITRNSAGKGDYFDGMQPGTTAYPGYEDWDDVTKDFGDPEEGLLKRALNYLKTNSYISVTQSNQPIDAGLRSFSALQPKVAADLDDHKFNGMIHDKPLKVKR